MYLFGFVGNCRVFGNLVFILIKSFFNFFGEIKLGDKCCKESIINCIYRFWILDIWVIWCIFFKEVLICKYVWIKWFNYMIFL